VYRLIQALVMDIVAGRSRHQPKSGVPRSMKMGTIASPCRYDAAARHALQSVKLRRRAILHYASWAAVYQRLRLSWPVVELCRAGGTSRPDQSAIERSSPCGVRPGGERPPNVEALMDRLSQVISRRSHWLLQTRKLSTALIVRLQLQLQIL
jgi:hypothetical protein